jgi:hypothetical protein
MASMRMVSLLSTGARERARHRTGGPKPWRYRT